jgi:D-aminoacyl-tRNA deacylase
VKAILQRVSHAAVEVGGETIGEIGPGLLILLGVAADDPAGTEELLARKAAGLRIFRDEGGRMNLSVADVGGAVLVVSQFTLLADCRQGRRPSFTGAAPPVEAEARYERFCAALAEEGLRVETGRFGADMNVTLLNQGPVTIVLDSETLAAPRRS